MIGCIIQARMGSTRLPGKILEKVDETNHVLKFLINQLEYSRNWHWNWSKFYFRKKHFGFTKAFLFGILIFFKSILKSLFFLIIQNKFKSKLYYYRASGFLNALLNKRSWFRPRFD